MANIARIPITNIYMDGDYTGRILVGPKQTPLNVILDTGSSALALDAQKYAPDFAGGDQSTDLAQTDTYGEGSSWTGAVIETAVAIGSGADQVVLSGANAAIAYDVSDGMFGDADGILGLAYAALDDAYRMPSDTSKTQFPATQVSGGTKTDLVPYLTQLEDQKVTSDIIAFLTRRSFVHVGMPDPASDLLNQGWMIVGGGEEATDLYTGPFQSVKVTSDAWYCTNLKSIQVGSTAPIAVPRQGPKGQPSNSIIDSGTNSLNLSGQMLLSIFSKLTKAQEDLLISSMEGNTVATSDLDLAQWPTLTFVLEGSTADVTLTVKPQDYWQVDTGSVGAAAAAITQGDPDFAILGLPLMNGYFVIFDGEADNGRGVVKFAAAK